MNPEHPIVGTYSIVAFDPASGDLGVAVQSKFFGVGTVVPWARAGVGAIATQSSANITYGPRGLDLLANGSTPEQTVRLLTETDEGRDSRQLGIVDAQGRALFLQALAEVNGRGHPHIVGVLLEGEAEHADFLVLQHPQCVREFFHEALHLIRVDALHFLE